MQSGVCGVGKWVVTDSRKPFPGTDLLMGWNRRIGGHSDEVFSTKEKAIEYCCETGRSYRVVSYKKDKVLNIRSMGYAENFKYNRRTPWTH